MEARVVRWTILFALSLTAAFGPLSPASAAVNLFWTGANSTQYGDGQNWSSIEGPSAPPAFAIPAAGNFAVFEKSASVDFSSFFPGQPPVPDNVQILFGAVTFNLGPISYQDAVARTFTTNQLYVVAPFEDGNFLNAYGIPNGANGSLFASGGTIVVNGDTEIGGGVAKNVGTLTLQASQLTTGGNVTVAQSSQGNLNITTASLMLSSGGNVAIGNQVGSVGTATVSGGSTWLLTASAPLIVGLNGTGSLFVQSGSLVSGVTLNIGSTSVTPGAVTVDGAGSKLSFTNLNVGFGSGTLTVQNGGSVTSGSSNGSTFTIIGGMQGSNGAATVTGVGSSWNTNGLEVGGGGGHGSLVISSGATVTSSDYQAIINGTNTTISSSIGGNNGSVQVTGSGSTWTLTGGLAVSNYGNNSGTLNVGVGAKVNVATTLQVSPGGTVQLDGTLNAATVNIDTGSFTQTGTVNISDPTTHTGVLSLTNGGSYIGAPVLGIPSPGNTDAVGHAYVQGNGSSWTIPTAYFLGAGGGLGTAEVDFGGTVLSGDLGVGEQTEGQLYVNGPGASWTSSGTITVGSVAKGRVTATNNGSISTGTLTVNAHGGVNVTSGGSLQTGNLNINGGFVQVDFAALTTTNTTITSGGMQLTNPNWNNNGTLYVGGDSSGPGADSPTGFTSMVSVLGGTATVGGSLKIYSPGQITVDNNAVLNVQDVNIPGGSLDVYSGTVQGHGGSLTISAHGEYSQSNGDFDSSSFPSVHVSGALFNIQNGSINLGSGQSLTADGGALIHANALNINPGANASIAASTIEADSVYVAGGLSLNNATLNLDNLHLDGGTITAVTPLAIKSSLEGHGAIQGNVQLVNGGLIASGGSLAVSGDISGYGVVVGNVTYNSLTPTGDLVIGGNKNDLGSQAALLLSTHPARLEGKLTSDGGTVTSPSGIAIAGSGQLLGNITIHGDVTNDGFVDVGGYDGGEGFGLDSIYGNLTLDDPSIVRVHIGGTDPADYDHIMVKDGDVTLGGTLDLVFVNGFLPKQGDVFNIFIDDFSGQFSDVQFSGLGNWDFSVTGGPTGVTLNSMSDATPLPEPNTLGLLVLSLPDLWWASRRAKATAR